MDKKIDHPSHFQPRDWPTELIPSLQLAPDVSPSPPIGPPGVVAWLHQKLVYLSRVLDVYCSTFFYRVQSETSSLTNTHTHTSDQRTSHNALRRYPGFAARPAGTDADTSKCSTGITFPLDTRLSYRPTRYWQTRHLKGGETESSNRTSLSAGYCFYRRRVKRLTSEKKKETEIVLRLVKSQADFSAGFEKYKTDRTFNNPCVSLLTALGRRGRHSRENWQKHPFTYWNTCRLDPLA